MPHGDERIMVAVLCFNAENARVKLIPQHELRRRRQYPRYNPHQRNFSAPTFCMKNAFVSSIGSNIIIIKSNGNASGTDNKNCFLYFRSMSFDSRSALLRFRFRSISRTRIRDFGWYKMSLAPKMSPISFQPLLFQQFRRGHRNNVARESFTNCILNPRRTRLTHHAGNVKLNCVWFKHRGVAKSEISFAISSGFNTESFATTTVADSLNRFTENDAMLFSKSDNDLIAFSWRKRTTRTSCLPR